ncbi:MAG TPA: isocitrate lyase/phosphoenolpyruvate mutase family protein [Trebonia sp.]|jgi:2-methylisocitrate lyase-like PEP mutase family enzyme|nr:isocitrate lyase/phosphoenolpyruvate mutase family protein [Trebonia sp.]
MILDADDQRNRGEEFRRLHAGPAFVVPNPWDAGSARVFAGLGFAALATTSGGLAAGLGKPDGQATREQTLANVGAIAAATALPVTADLESGFGATAADVADTIRMAVEAGAVGGSVEDSTGDSARPVRPLDEAIERVAAAAEAAHALPFPFTLTARAENFLYGRPDLDDTIARLRAFESAGADVLYAPGLPDLDAIRAVCTAVGKPVNVLAGGSAGISVADLAARGARRVSVGSTLARVALTAVIDAAREIHDEGTFSLASGALSYREVNELWTARNLCRPRARDHPAVQLIGAYLPGYGRRQVFLVRAERTRRLSRCRLRVLARQRLVPLVGRVRDEDGLRLAVRPEGDGFGFGTLAAKAREDLRKTLPDLRQRPRLEH